MRARPNSRQRGFILMTVALVGMIATLTMGSIFNSGVVQEQRAVETRLAEIRAYWQIMGHYHYAFSRIRQARLCADADGACNSSDNFQDVVMASILQGYLNEISALRRFTFPEESANYWIDIGTTAMQDPTPSKHPHSNHLWMRSTFPSTQSTLPILSGVESRFRRLELRMCVNMATQNTPCGPLSSNNFGGELNGLYRVMRLAKW